jgi:hypothetical protein
MRANRGQSSVEYLMTYGWAFIILLAVIAILYSFGVFNPQQYMGEECLFQPSLQCKSMTLISSTGVFNLALNNGLGYTIKTASCEAQLLSTGAAPVKCSLQGPVPPNMPISITTTFPTSTLRTATLEKVKVTLKYTIGDNPEEYTTSGMVSVRVS